MEGLYVFIMEAEHRCRPRYADSEIDKACCFSGHAELYFWQFIFILFSAFQVGDVWRYLTAAGFSTD